VVGIFDADQPDAKAKCEAEFPDYHFVLLPAEDIRDKDPVKAKPAKRGLWKSREGLDPAKRQETIAMYDNIKAYLNGEEVATPAQA
jgi:hypothetical protein